MPLNSTIEEAARAFFELTVRRISRFHSAAAEFGLSPFQAKALGCFCDGKAKAMTEVAQATGCNASNLTGVIDKLEARGLVQRQSSPNDRRIKMVFLSEAGTALREQLIERLQEPPEWMLALGEDEQRQLLDILNKGLAHGQESKSGESS